LFKNTVRSFDIGEKCSGHGETRNIYTRLGRQTARVDRLFPQLTWTCYGINVDFADVGGEWFELELSFVT
jgi:hypothetical protein